MTIAERQEWLASSLACVCLVLLADRVDAKDLEGVGMALRGYGMARAAIIGGDAAQLEVVDMLTGITGVTSEDISVLRDAGLDYRAAVTAAVAAKNPKDGNDGN
jgi:hypothetical protein